MALGALTILLGAAISYAAYKLIGPMIKKSDDEDDIPGTSPSTSSNINDSNNNSSGGINAARHVSSYTKGQLAGGGFNSDTIAQLDHDRAAFLKGEDSNSGGTHARTPARCPFTGDKLSDDDDDDEDEGENGGGCCPIVADIEEDVEELNKALKDKEITGKPIADSATPARSQQLFDDNDAGSGPCTTDVLDRLGDLHGKLATAKLRMQQREFEKQMSDKEREEESAVRARQMEAIFALMQQHQDKFGIQNEAEFAEQMRMYST